MKKYKLVNRVTLVAILMCIVLAIILGIVVHLKNRDVYFLKLPEVPNIESIILEMKNKETKYIVKRDDITEIMNIIKGNFRTTKEESTKDVPKKAKKLVTIHINTDTGLQTVYTYRKGFKYYIEQPQGGIYRITKSEYKNIYKYIK